jgi:MFS family permease
MKKYITKNIFILSMVSLLTDVASEMLYPVIPLYIQELGYGAVVLGWIEGVAETCSGLSKVFFGHLSDKLGKRNVFIRWGYGISAFSKPLFALYVSPLYIFLVRFLDRAGKGIRTAPRDAVLVAESEPANRGKVFGFHRGMDTFGAMLGPVISLLFLLKFPHHYKELFLIAFIPGLISFACTFYIKDRTTDKSLSFPDKKQKLTIGMFKQFFSDSSINYRRLLIGSFLIALLNSSNMFLILRAKELGMSDVHAITAYIIYNLVFALISFPIGVLVDKYGFKPFYIIGLCVFALSYGFFGMASLSFTAIMSIFAFYGVFSAIEESVGRSWLSLHIPPESRATGFGLQLSLNAVAFLVGSLLMGLLWNVVGGQLAFTIISLCTIIDRLLPFLQDRGKPSLSNNVYLCLSGHPQKHDRGAICNSNTQPLFGAFHDCRLQQK